MSKHGTGSISMGSDQMFDSYCSIFFADACVGLSLRNCHAFFLLFLVGLSFRGPRDIAVEPFAIGHHRIKQRGAFNAAVL